MDHKNLTIVSLGNDDPIEPLIYTQLSWEEKLHLPYWRAQLSTGDNVYSKNGRRSWLELKSWLQINPSIYIVGLWFQFRDNIIEIGVGNRDYIFSHVANCYNNGPTFHHFLGGYLSSNKTALLRKYRMPELLFDGEEIRNLTDPTVIKGLIKGK